VIEDRPATGTSLVMVTMSGALTVNRICVTSSGICANAIPEPVITMKRLSAMARREFFSMVVLADLPLSSTVMVTLVVPRVPVDESPPPQLIVIANKERTESTNIILLMTNLCFSLRSFMNELDILRLWW
jgi:hypothetical protein